MTVRKISKTTVSAAAFIVGFVFFRLYYIKLLSMLAGWLSVHFSQWEIVGIIYEIEDTVSFMGILSGKLYPVENIGAYFASLFYFCVVVILIVRTFNAILSLNVALGFFLSFKQPLLFILLISMALIIEKLNILQLWAIFYILIIICLHSTFRILLSRSTIIGSYGKRKKLKAFVITLKDTVKKINSLGVKSIDNPIDNLCIFFIAVGILLLQLITVISFAVYLFTHWRLIFLSSLAAGSL